MNIFLRELKAGRKAFVLWSIGLFVLVFAGITKYTGVVADGASVSKITDQFPQVVQAVLGIAGVNIAALGGYYSVLVFYALICSSIYGISLAANAVNRETVDRTYEFIFTKPRSRSFVLLVKLGAGFVYLVLFSLLNYLFSIAAVAALGLQDNIDKAMVLFSISVFLVGFIFFSLSACICAATKHAEKGTLYCNICFVIAFIVGIICDTTENCGILRLFSPLKYFVSGDVLNNKLDFPYVAVVLLFSTVMLAVAFVRFDKKDITKV